MSFQQTRSTLGLITLRLGIVIPFLDYGIQVAAAPFFPDFSFVSTTASEMGSSLSQHPSVFNTGIATICCLEEGEPGDFDDPTRDQIAADFAFIAAARTELPALIAEVRRLRADTPFIAQ
jgi:hypothetical protein